MSEFYGNIVENLKLEAKHLNDKLLYCRNKDDMNGYIATLRSLKDTLDLIKKYDWQLMYSEYGVERIKPDETLLDDLIKKHKNEESRFLTEIAVWEQNHEGQIRNHKIWTTNIPYKFNSIDKEISKYEKIIEDKINQLK